MNKYHLEDFRNRLVRRVGRKGEESFNTVDRREARLVNLRFRV